MTNRSEVRGLAHELWDHWQQGLRPDVRAFLGRADALPSAGIVAVLRVDQRERWIGGERVPARAYLRDFPELSDDPEAVLELIYGEYLIREELGESPDLEEYTRSYPDHAERLRIQLELHRAMHESADEGPSDGESTWEDDAPSVVSARGPGQRRRSGTLPELDGYELREELGRGGMSVVYKARESQLNRDVAIKMIRAVDLSEPDALIRFRQEAEVIARLRHPHIVQIHRIGEQDGHPYIALEYVEGGSLDRRSGDAPWSPREAARLIEVLARAIHEAHVQGVIHRDLKPANILLDRGGVPKITDFGLAKCLSFDSELTRTHTLIGSPRYMAPEQAVGDGPSVGPGTDVHALGVILYELLTGRPPFLAETPQETLNLVRTHEAVPPSRFHASIPRDIETICLKCLQKDPSHRYARADALAEDLGRFLAGEAIRARPIGSIERLWRWCRREPVRAGLVATLAVSLACGFGGVAVQWRRAEIHLAEVRRQRSLLETSYSRLAEVHRDLQNSLALEKGARLRAQSRFDLTLKAVNEFSTLAREDQLSRGKTLEGLRGRLLDSALRFYRTLQQELASDPTPQARGALSSSLARMAFIQLDTGSKADALDAFRRALEIVEVSVAERPDDPQRQAALARGHDRIGYALRGLGRNAEALASYRRGRAVLEALVRRAPDDVGFRDELSWNAANTGVILRETGNPPGAVAELGLAVSIREGLAAEDPENVQKRSDLAWSRRDFSSALRAAGRTGEALRLLERARDVFEALALAQPADVQIQDRLAYTLTSYGSLQRHLGRLASARPPIERALAIRTALLRDHPLAVSYRIGLASLMTLDAQMQAKEGNLPEARRRIHRAEDFLSRIPANEAARVWYDVGCAYAVCHGLTAHAIDATADRSQDAQRAMDALRRAIAAGFADGDLVRRDTDLDPLRSRDDFRELMADLIFPDWPFAG